jgi:hypothetical protein
MNERGLTIRWGTGSFFAVFRHNDIEHVPFLVRAGDSNAYAEIEFGRLKENPPFSEETLRKQLLAQLRRIPGVSIKDDAITRYPTIKFSTLNQGDSLKQFLECMDWVIADIRKGRPT